MLLENEIDDVANLGLLKDLIITLNQQIQNLEAKLSMQIKHQLNLESLSHQSRLIFHIIEINTVIEKTPRNELAIRENNFSARNHSSLKHWLDPLVRSQSVCCRLENKVILPSWIEVLNNVHYVKDLELAGVVG